MDDSEDTETESVSSSSNSDTDSEYSSTGSSTASSESSSEATTSESTTNETSESSTTYSSSSDEESEDTGSTNKLKRFCSALPEFTTSLYQGADLSVLDSYILLYEYALRHSLTKQAFAELISLVSVHLPRSAHCATSFHMLKKYFIEHFNDTSSEVKKYCTQCHRLMEDVSSCPSGCEGATNKFLYIPIEIQLKRKLEGEHVLLVVLVVSYTLVKINISYLFRRPLCMEAAAETI